MTNLVIYDFVSGRTPGGHQEDYLCALEEALTDYRVRTFAPFRRPQRNTFEGTPTFAASNRLQRYLAGLTGFWRLLSERQPTLIIVPNAAPLDFVLLYLALLLVKPGGKGHALFVMRRDAAGIAGRSFRAHILEWLVRRIVRSGHFSMVSDSRAAMAFWREATGRDGPIVSIPTRKPPQTRPKCGNDPIIIGLIGGFRIEKGAAHYNDVITTVLDCAPDTQVECQLSLSNPSPREHELADTLLAHWSENPRVRFHRGHLSDDAFTSLLYETDAIILPYDVDCYGPGTSGVMFEAIAAGRIVASTRISWAVQEYSQHPNLVWLDAPSKPSLSATVSKIVARIRSDRQSGQPIEVCEDTFKNSWIAALACTQNAMKQQRSRP